LCKISLPISVDSEYFLCIKLNLFFDFNLSLSLGFALRLKVIWYLCRGNSAELAVRARIKLEEAFGYLENSCAAILAMRGAEKLVPQYALNGAKFKVPAVWVDGWCQRCFLTFADLVKYQKSY
jgi:hypothetical protein